MVVPAPSLYTVNAVIIMDVEGSRLLSKYYTDAYSTLKSQQAFEKSLFSKTHKQPNDEVVMVDGNIVVYKTNMDVTIYVVGSPEQNEPMLEDVLDCFIEALSEVLKPQLDKRSMMECFEAVVLILDDLIDRGIILESNPQELANRIQRRVESIADISLNEQTIASALQFAKDKLARHLLQ